ncbi:MAG: hypothetical protein MUP67_04820 [Acidimicrobiia bacterium]|nr:hypothetical protein [Acidimicrobiia bacterium]
MSLPVLASELLDKSIWYPTILGVLVVVAGVLLFVGSIYLLLSTNLGARLGFLIAFTALMGFMVVLTSLWVVTASPLNTLKGRIPSWKAVELVNDPSAAKTPEVRNIQTEGVKVDTIEASNVKASADENLIAVEALPGEAQVTQQAFARFQAVTEYKVLNTYEIGGSNPNPLDFEATHTPKFAVIEFCEVVDPTTLVPFGVAPPPPECKAGSDKSGFIVLKRDLGSLRVPPFVAWISSILLFGLGLLLLHWREKDERAAKRRAEAPAETSAEDAAPVPANA